MIFSKTAIIQSSRIVFKKEEQKEVWMQRRCLEEKWGPTANITGDPKHNMRCVDIYSSLL